MKTTRIAGLTNDPLHAARLRQTARIYSYTRHIRRLAHDATPMVASAHEPEAVSGDRHMPTKLSRLIPS